MADSKIGGAFFELSVNRGEFERDISAAGNAARTATTDIGGGADNANAKMKSLGGSVKDATAGFHALVSAGSRILGLFGLLTSAAMALGEVLNAKTKAAIDNMKAYEDALVRISAMEDKLAARRGEEGPAAYARQQNNAYQEMLRQLQDVYENAKLSSKSKDEISKQIREIFQGPGGIFQTIDEEFANASIAELYRVEQARMESNRRVAAQAKKDAEEEFKAFLDQDQRRQDTLRESAKARYDEEKRLSDQRMRDEINNIRRLEDYRRSLTQGFGVGDTATTDLGSLTRAIQDLASTQIQTRD